MCTVSIALRLTLFSLLASACQAQTFQPRRRRSVTGSVIAGIVIAVVGGLLLCCLLSAIAVRRRRGQSYLPGPGGGFLQPNRTGYGNAQPQAAGFGNTNHQYNQQQPEWNNNTATAGGVGTYQPPAGPPPAYHGKETYVGQGQNGGAPQPGGFAPPPGPPSAAHVNDNSGRQGWFNKGSR